MTSRYSVCWCGNVTLTSVTRKPISLHMRCGSALNQSEARSAAYNATHKNTHIVLYRDFFYNNASDLRTLEFPPNYWKIYTHWLKHLQKRHSCHFITPFEMSWIVLCFHRVYGYVRTSATKNHQEQKAEPKSAILALIHVCLSINF